MKKLLVIAVLFSFLLAGCAANTVKPPTEKETVNESTIDTCPQPEETDSFPQAVSSESSVYIDSLEESAQDTDEIKPETGAVPKADDYKEIVPSANERTESSSSQAVTTSAPKETEPKAAETKPQETEAPKETEKPKQTEPPKQPEETKPVETEAETEPEATFDINYWISFAQNAAVSKGLTLESSAVDCWDNPITANPDCIYLERDINSRLNRYAGDEDITDVWIWYECIGANRYLIYIGYA